MSVIALVGVSEKGVSSDSNSVQVNMKIDDVSSTNSLPSLKNLELSVHSLTSVYPVHNNK